jgi:diguanylate cyclase (GGDEF)-like protein
MKQTIELSIISYILKPIDIELLLKGIEKASFKIENERLKSKLHDINKGLELKVAEKTEALQVQNKKLYQQVYTDELTNLPNRKAFIRDIELVKNPIVSIVDIDEFKRINDTYGEVVGNIALCKVAKLLNEAGVQRDCKVYRIGSDEFVLLRDEKFKIETCIKTISMVIDTINKDLIYVKEYDISLRIDVTIGISTEQTNTIETAGMALKVAKNDKIAYKIYCDKCSLYEEYKNDMTWTRIIEKAVNNNLVVPYYQPIVDKDKNIIKYEALMRIIDDENIYPPFKFLNIAKKAKLYSKMVELMIAKVLEKINETGMRISINLSIEDILNEKLIDFIETELEKSNNSHLVTFELLENKNIIEYSQAMRFIERIKEIGCTVAIDDFGSGYSNFQYLLELQPDYIKIDGSSIQNINTDKNSYLITKTINDFAHSLNIKTVAEFVHNKEVFNMLKELGVDEYQGYYFSEPLSDF